MGRRALPLICDVSKETDIQKTVEQVVVYYGRIDILLNNADVAVPGTVEQLGGEDLDTSMNINVSGMFLKAKYMAPYMRETKYGKIVNIDSVNAIFSDKSAEPARHVYNASKSAVLGLTIGIPLRTVKTKLRSTRSVRACLAAG